MAECERRECGKVNYVFRIETFIDDASQAIRRRKATSRITSRQLWFLYLKMNEPLRAQKLEIIQTFIFGHFFAAGPETENYQETMVIEHIKQDLLCTRTSLSKLGTEQANAPNFGQGMA